MEIVDTACVLYNLIVSKSSDFLSSDVVCKNHAGFHKAAAVKPTM